MIFSYSPPYILVFFLIPLLQGASRGDVDGGGEYSWWGRWTSYEGPMKLLCLSVKVLGARTGMRSVAVAPWLETGAASVASDE